MADEIYKIHKLLSGYPEEVLFAWMIAYEEIYHTGVQPKSAVFSDLMRAEDPTVISNGLARSDRNVGPGFDAVDSSLCVRLWCAGAVDVDEVYGNPTGPEFIDRPAVTLGSLKFSEQSDRSLTQMEFGQEFEETATLRVPYYWHLINSIPEPEEGDMVEFWAEGWHSFGVFYNIVKVNRGGRINQTPYFTEWLLELERQEKFLPERRLFGSGQTPLYAGDIYQPGPSPPPGQPPGGGGPGTPPAGRVQVDVICITNPLQTTYSLSQFPAFVDTIEVYLNGLRLVPGPGFDYIASSDSVQILAPIRINDVLLISYQY